MVRREFLGLLAGVIGSTAMGSMAGKPAPAYVRVSGSGLALRGQPFTIHSATTYARLGDPDGIISLAQQARLNTLEVVEFEYEYRNPSHLMSEQTWTRVDSLLAKCRSAGLKIILNFSSYGKTLAANGTKPSTHDWGPYLSFVMNRTNTVTGVKYRNDPTIIKIQLYAEIAAPNYSEQNRGTTQETTDFFNRSLRQLREVAPNHVISTGGFSYLNDPGSGIDFETIMSDSYNQVCDIELNSWPDRDIAVPLVAAHAAEIGKPWFLSAFSAGPGDPHHAEDANHYPNGDPDMADHFEDCYRIARHSNPTAPAPAQAGCGASFWNLGAVPAGDDVLDIGPQYPLTFAEVQAWAP